MGILSLHTPIGDLTVFDDGGSAIIALDWGWVEGQEPTPLLQEAKRQLDLYFDGDLTKFDLPLAPHGTAFQNKVWQEMVKIPAGKTMSYGEIAVRLSSGARPVGTACGRNPIPIIIPCHRVVASGGALGGYSGEGGTVTKTSLLALEGAFAVPTFYE